MLLRLPDNYKDFPNTFKCVRTGENINVTGWLFNYSFVPRDNGVAIHGAVSSDIKNRFRNGEGVTTSRILHIDYLNRVAYTTYSVYGIAGLRTGQEGKPDNWTELPPEAYAEDVRMRYTGFDIKTAFGMY